MDKKLLKDALGWGFALWLIGYLLSIVLFFLVPANMIGWVIMPIGTATTLWVLFKKVNGHSFGYYAVLAAIWTLMAIILDYIFVVKALNPADGYYKPAVYIYYILTFALPFIAASVESKNRKHAE